tara:strand:+ start:920 stop:1351 length:432 start_codon:yes stop_codon:yes gene_type:complete
MVIIKNIDYFCNFTILNIVFIFSERKIEIIFKLTFLIYAALFIFTNLTFPTEIYAGLIYLAVGTLISGVATLVTYKRIADNLDKHMKQCFKFFILGFVCTLHASASFSWWQHTGETLFLVYSAGFGLWSLWFMARTWEIAEIR